MPRSRFSRALAQQVQIGARKRPPRPPQSQHRDDDWGPMLVKLDDHLPAPTDDFEADPFTPTTVTAKRMRRIGENGGLKLNLERHYEVDEQEDDEGNGPITVVNRFPWVWEYKHAYLWVEQFNGEWVPRQPLYSIVLGKTTTAHGKGDTEAVNVYWGATAGSEPIVTGESIDAYNRWADIDSGKWCELQWRVNGWKLINGEC